MAVNSGRLRIAFLYDDSLDRDDGVAQYVKSLGGYFSARGHEVTYLVGQSKMTQWQGGTVYSLSKNLSVAWNRNRLSMPLTPKMKAIKKVIADNDFDVVHVQVPYSPLMAQLIINLLPKTTAIVGTVHIFPANWLTRAGSKALKTIYGKSFRRIDELVSVSQAANEYAKDAWKIDTAIIPNTVDISKYLQAANSKHTDRIVFLGRLVKRKGCEELIKAFSIVLKNKPRAKLIIAGDGPDLAKLKKLVKKIKLNDSVEFVGYVDEPAKVELLASARIACFPSLYGESFGIVLIEAMASGGPVVLGGNNPGYQTVLGDSPKQLVDPTNVGEFAERLSLLLSNDKLADRLRAWQSVEVKKYDLPAVAQQTVELYRRAIAKRSR